MVQGGNFVLRSAPGKGPAPSGAETPAGEDLSDWLQEAAKRSSVSGPPTINRAAPAMAGPEAVRESRLRRDHLRGREFAGFSALTIAFLQYYYLDVMVQIGNLPKVVVFVPMVVG